MVTEKMAQWEGSSLKTASHSIKTALAALECGESTVISKWVAFHSALKQSPRLLEPSPFSVYTKKNQT